MRDRRLELYRRHLDGELSPADARELEELLSRDRLAPAELSAYRALVDQLRSAPAPELPADFAARVMRRLPAAPRRAWWREMLLKPRLNLIGVLGLSALAALVWLPLRALRGREAAAPPATGVATNLPHEVAPVGVTPSRIVVRFVLPARGARRVALAGDFNGWRTDDIVLTDERGDGMFTATVSLPQGRHSYLFWVDGHWMQDPAAGSSLPDGFGQRNSVLDL